VAVPRACPPPFREYGVALIDGTATAVNGTAEVGFTVQIAGREPVVARRVLLANGCTDVLPDVPGLASRWGRDLLHCPYCHGYEVRDRRLGVLGGTPDAVQHALLVRQWSSDVLYFPHTDVLDDVAGEQLAARGIGVVEGVVAGLVVADDRLAGVELEDGRRVQRAAVFVRPRLIANSAVAESAGCRLDENRWPEADATGRTSVPGIWAAGNVADPRAQVITAAGEGSSAAIAINADLVAEEVARDVAILRARGAPPGRRSPASL
jgi:thioredoxin reductase